MKKNSIFTKLRKTNLLKETRPSRLRLENLEERQLLSVTDLAALAVPSDNAEPIQLATAANLSDALIDVGSALEAGETNSFGSQGNRLVITPTEFAVYNTSVNADVAFVLLDTIPFDTDFSVDNDAFTFVRNDMSTGHVSYVGGLPSGTYTLTVTAACDSLVWTGTFDAVIHKATLAKPANLRTTEATTSSIALAWDAVPYADQYEVGIHDGNGFQWQTVGTNSCTITGLSSNTYYFFEVIAVGDDMINSDREFGSVATPSFVNLRGVDVYNTDTNVVVADVLTYDFDNPTLSLDNDAFDLVDNQVVFLGGASGFYTLTLTVSDSDLTQTESFNIAVNKTKLAAVANLDWTKTNNSVAFTWDAVPYADEYAVYSHTDKTTIWVDAPYFSETGLANDTYYYYTFYAVGDDMIQSEGLVVGVRTLNYALEIVPTNVAYNTDTNVAVGNVHTYDFVPQTITTDNDAFAVVGESVVFLGGASGTYPITITATDGEVTLTKSLEIVVCQAKLATPVNLRTAEATVSSITLAWDSVPYATRYEISCDGSTYTTDTNSLVITGLRNRTLYDVLVFATGDDMIDSDVACHTAETLSYVTPISVEIYTTDANVAVANIATNGFVNPEITVDNEKFAIVDNQVVFLGGEAGTHLFAVTIREGENAVFEMMEIGVQQAKLAAPANFRTLATPNAITFTWDAVPDAIGYEVLFNDALVTISTNSYTATGLPSNTEFQFAVAAYGNPAVDIENSDWAYCDASTFSCVSQFDVYVYNTDSNVAVAAVAATGFNAPEITVDNEAFAIVDNQVVFLSGLSGTYTIEVTVAEGEVALTDTFDVIVRQGSLAAPANLRVTAVTSDSISLAWNADPRVIGCDVFYDVILFGDGIKEWRSDTNSITVTGLKSNMEYEVCVCAWTYEEYWDSEDAVLVVRTLAEGSGWASLSTDSPIFGGSIVVNIAPDSTATYAWYSVNADNVETPLGAATSEYHIVDSDLIGGYLKVVVTYTSGDFAGQEVSVTTANPVAQEIPDVTISQVVPYVGAELTAHLTIPGATAAYQWYRVGDGGEEVIAEATSSSYTVTAADVGFYLKVVATGTGDYTGSASATTTVLAIADNPLTLSTLDPLYGYRITSRLNPGDSRATYQWQTLDESTGEWVDINGAVYSYFTPGYSYIGKYTSQCQYVILFKRLKI